MNRPLSPESRIVSSLVITLLVVAGLGPVPILAADAPPSIAVRGLFFHATKRQLEAALESARADPTANVLTPKQFETVRAALKRTGTDPFSDPSVVCQRGHRAVVEEVKEVRYPTRYEPSKKEPGKLVPVRFAMRLAGVILEVATSIDGNGRIRLETTPTFTRFLGFIDYSNLKPNAANPPALEELLKGPLNAGGRWQPFFATFTDNRTFALDDGETAIMSGSVAVEQWNPPPGQPVLQSGSPATEVLVFVTARKVIRD